MTPTTLYRGIVINDDQIKTAPYFGTNLTPFHPAKTDANGHKTIGDGNEYGVYMSDNLTMVECAYGKVRKYHGRPLAPNMRISINGDPAPVTYPSIGVIYAVSTDGLTVREPWMCKAMSGHANNGFEGKEWLADEIPASNYTITKFTLSADWLHPEQTFIVTNLQETQDIIERIISGRRIRLQRLQDVMNKIPERRRLCLSSDDARTLWHLFSKGGAGYTLPECLHPSNAYEYAMYLMTYFYRNSKELDWTNLNYVTGLIRQLPSAAPFSTLISLVQNDIAEIQSLRANFIRKKIVAGEPVITPTGFDTKIARFEFILRLLLEKYNEQH